MRVGEALRLDCGDLDWDQAVIKVRDTKFGKGRDVTVAASTIEALAAYRRRRDRRQPATPRLFVSLAGTPVIYSGFALAFRQAVAAAGVGADGPARPRVHDLRHSFAVRTLVGWYRAGLDARRCCPGCPPTSGTGSRASPTGISPPPPSCSVMPPRGWRPPRRRSSDRGRPHARVVVHRQAGPSAPGQPPHHRVLPGHAPAADVLHAGQNRQSPLQPGLGRPGRGGDLRLPGSPGDRPAQRPENPQPPPHRHQVPVPLRRPAPPRARRGDPAGAGHTRQALQPRRP